MKASKELKDYLHTSVNRYFEAFTKAYGKAPTVDNVRDVYRHLHSIDFNLTQDDNHPFFVQGLRKRLIPCTGSFYRWAYYREALNDDHIETLVKTVPQFKAAFSK